MQYNSNTHQWIDVAQLSSRYKGKKLEIAVLRKPFGLQGNGLTFDFHWCGNPSNLKDPISLCIDGDSAPKRRFNYRCIWKK